MRKHQELLAKPTLEERQPQQALLTSKLAQLAWLAWLASERPSYTQRSREESREA